VGRDNPKGPGSCDCGNNMYIIRADKKRSEGQFDRGGPPASAGGDGGDRRHRPWQVGCQFNYLSYRVMLPPEVDVHVPLTGFTRPCLAQLVGGGWRRGVNQRDQTRMDGLRLGRVPHSASENRCYSSVLSCYHDTCPLATGYQDVFGLEVVLSCEPPQRYRVTIGRGSETGSSG
jgi:hypothetical protein